MSVIWLRTAAAFYCCGLLYTLIYLFRKSARLFLPALITFGVGAVFHLVAIAERWMETGRLPLENFYETSSLCAFALAFLFLISYSYYRVALFGVCIFPVVFFMTLIGATEFPLARWSDQVRSVWLVLHVVTVVIGYAALIFSAMASIFYLLQERQLKNKAVMPSMNRLPPLGTLDRIITQSMNTGFLFITLATMTGVIWAYNERGADWIGYPRILLFLFTWGFYLLMIFLRLSAGWRGRRIAWMAVSVLACSIVTWATHMTFRGLLLQ